MQLEESVVMAQGSEASVEEHVKPLLQVPDIFFVNHQACHDGNAAAAVGAGLVNETDVQR